MDFNEYHAYFCHSSADFSWAMNLINSLESDKNKFKCAEYERDYIGGRLVMELFEGFMNTSNFIVVVLSPSFVESKWSMFQLLLAVQYSLDKNLGNIIPLVYKECEVPLCMKIFDPLNVSVKGWRQKLIERLGRPAKRFPKGKGICTRDGRISIDALRPSTTRDVKSEPPIGLDSTTPLTSLQYSKVEWFYKIRVDTLESSQGDKDNKLGDSLQGLKLPIYSQLSGETARLKRNSNPKLRVSADDIMVADKTYPGEEMESRRCKHCGNRIKTAIKHGANEIKETLKDKTIRKLNSKKNPAKKTPPDFLNTLKEKGNVIIPNKAGKMKFRKHKSEGKHERRKVSSGNQTGHLNLAQTTADNQLARYSNESSGIESYERHSDESYSIQHFDESSNIRYSDESSSIRESEESSSLRHSDESSSIRQSQESSSLRHSDESSSIRQSEESSSLRHSDESSSIRQSEESSSLRHSDESSSIRQSEKSSSLRHSDESSSIRQSDESSSIRNSDESSSIRHSEESSSKRHSHGDTGNLQQCNSDDGVFDFRHSQFCKDADDDHFLISRKVLSQIEISTCSEVCENTAKQVDHLETKNMDTNTTYSKIEATSTSYSNSKCRDGNGDHLLGDDDADEDDGCDYVGVGSKDVFSYFSLNDDDNKENHQEFESFGFHTSISKEGKDLLYSGDKGFEREMIQDDKSEDAVKMLDKERTQEGGNDDAVKDAFDRGHKIFDRERTGEGESDDAVKDAFDRGHKIFDGERTREGQNDDAVKDSFNRGHKIFDRERTREGQSDDAVKDSFDRGHKIFDSYRTKEEDRGDILPNKSHKRSNSGDPYEHTTSSPSEEELSRLQFLLPDMLLCGGEHAQHKRRRSGRKERIDADILLNNEV